MSTTRRRMGRPPLDPTSPSVELCVTIPSKQYDALYTKAKAEHVSIPEIIRRVLAQARPPTRLKVSD